MGAANTADVTFTCVAGGSEEECMKAIADNKADITSLGGELVSSTSAPPPLRPSCSERVRLCLPKAASADAEAPPPFRPSPPPCTLPQPGLAPRACSWPTPTSSSSRLPRVSVHNRKKENDSSDAPRPLRLAGRSPPSAATPSPLLQSFMASSMAPTTTPSPLCPPFFVPRASRSQTSRWAAAAAVMGSCCCCLSCCSPPAVSATLFALTPPTLRRASARATPAIVAPPAGRCRLAPL